MSDPATKAEVASWDPNTEYVVRTAEQPATGMVDTVEPEEEEPAAPEETAGAPGPAAVKAAMAGPIAA